MDDHMVQKPHNPCNHPSSRLGAIFPHYKQCNCEQHSYTWEHFYKVNSLEQNCWVRYMYLKNSGGNCLPKSLYWFTFPSTGCSEKKVFIIILKKQINSSHLLSVDSMSSTVLNTWHAFQNFIRTNPMRVRGTVIFFVTPWLCSYKGHSLD